MGLCTLTKQYCNGDVAGCEAYKMAYRSNRACYYYRDAGKQGKTPY